MNEHLARTNKQLRGKEKCDFGNSAIYFAGRKVSARISER